MTNVEICTKVEFVEGNMWKDMNQNESYYKRTIENISIVIMEDHV